MSTVGSITDVAGLTVGQAQRLDSPRVADAAAGVPGAGWATGVSVVLAGDGATGAVDVRGGAPGTRETDLLAPENSVQHVHAVALCGGSAFGLAAASGVMTELAGQGVGLDMGAGVWVPIVPAAVVFDLPVGAPGAVPDEALGAEAVRAAGRTVATGCAGAGTGARAGGLKGGVGTASVVIEAGPAAGATVGALVVANPVGAVVDPGTGLPYGAAPEDLAVLGWSAPEDDELAALAGVAAKGTVLNTTIGVVATDAALSKAQCRRLATAAHDGIARAVRPSHTPLDGDTVFALATGVRELEAEPLVPVGMDPHLGALTALAAAATTAMYRALVVAVRDASPVAGIECVRSLIPSAFAG